MPGWMWALFIVIVGAGGFMIYQMRRKLLAVESHRHQSHAAARYLVHQARILLLHDYPCWRRTTGARRLGDLEKTLQRNIFKHLEADGDNICSLLIRTPLTTHKIVSSAIWWALQWIEDETERDELLRQVTLAIPMVNLRFEMHGPWFVWSRHHGDVAGKQVVIHPLDFALQFAPA